MSPFLGFPGGPAGKEFACNAGDLGLISVWEDPLESMDCIVHESQSRTRPSDFHFHKIFTVHPCCHNGRAPSFLCLNPVQVSRSVMSNTLLPQGLQHNRLPCPSPTPGACSNSCKSSQWCHPTISSSVVPCSSWLQSFPASVSFPVNKFFPSGGQSIGASASASVLPMNIQDWFPLGLTG